MCSMSVLCPLCAQTSFSSIDALRCSLVQLASGPLACPICHELFLGLDKLTIHLFSHTNMMSASDAKNNTTQTTNTIRNNNNTSPSNHNNEKLETKEEVVPLDEATATNNAKNTNISNGLNFENAHPHPQDEYLGQPPPPPPPSLPTAVKKSKLSKSDSKKINKKPQVVLANESERNNSPTTSIHPATTMVVVNSLSNLATCDICEFTFRNEQLRDMHVRLVHQNFIYANPPENSRTNQLENTQLTTAQTEPDFKCHLCSKTFKMKGSLRVHLKVVHLMGLPYVNNSPKLSICDRIRHKESKQLKTSNVSNASSIAESSATPQANNNLYNLQPIALVPNMPTSPSSPSHSMGKLSVLNISQSTEFLPNAMDNANCPLSSNVLLVFNNNPPMSQNHATLITPTDAVADKESIGKIITTATNSSTTTTVPATAINSLDNPKIWECDVCSKAFTTKYFLKKHKRLHTGEMPYTCEICARTFTFQQSYHKHLLYHSDEKPHVCSTCGRAFKELSTLHNHERIHSGEKPFKCDVCGKSFRQRVSFLVHTRIHTGVMPYKCEICQKSFRYKVSQRTHKCQPLSREDSPSQNDSLDHISENFIKAFLENSTNAAQIEHLAAQNSPASNEIAAINEKVATPPSSSGSPPSTLNEHQALLSKTIDDIVVESCNKLGIGNGIGEGFSTVENVSDGSMSPSQKLQNMRLYSPQLVTPDLNGIEGDLTRFFLENSGGVQNIL